MSLEKAQSLIDKIISKRKETLASKITRYPKNNFTASDIHECDRYMVYSILDWDKRTLHDEGLQAIFDAGNKEEENVKHRIGYELGFPFIEQQTPFEIKNRKGEVICRGKIDGKLVEDGAKIPTEIKSMNENVFNQIKAIEDFHKKPLHRKYLRQMQLYLYGNNEEAGIFILSNFRTEKIFPVILDYGECEAILQRLERLWENVKRKEYPEPIDYDDKICGTCGFKHLCHVNVKNEGANFIDNPELEEKLSRLEELKPVAKEYKDLDEELKDPFKQQKIPEVVVGSKWIVKTKVSKEKRVDTKAMPDDIKEQYQKETEKVTVSFIKI